MSRCGLQPLCTDLVQSLLNHSKNEVSVHNYTLQHYMQTRHIIDMHQDLPRLLQAIDKGRPVYLYTGRGPSSPRMHLGHLIPFLFTRLLAESVGAARVVVQLSDDEKFVRNVGLNLDQVDGYCRTNTDDIWSVGFDKEKTIIFRNTEMINKLYPYYLQLTRLLPAKMVKAVMGADLDSGTIGSLAYPAMQMVPCIPEAVGLPAESLCVIPCAVDQYPFFRLARHLLKRLGREPPVLLCASRYLPAITPHLHFEGKMSSSDPRTAIFLGDTDDLVRQKVRRACSGAAASLAEHQQGGHVYIERDFAAQVLRVFEPDHIEYTRLIEEYTKGKVSSLSLKESAANAIINLFTRLKHQLLKVNVNAQYRQSS